VQIHLYLLSKTVNVVKLNTEKHTQSHSLVTTTNHHEAFMLRYKTTEMISQEFCNVLSCSALAPADMQSKLLQYKNNHHFTAIIQVSRHFQLRTGGLCWCLHTLEDGNSVQCRRLLNKVANIDRMPDISCTLKWDGRCHPKLPLSFDGIRAPNLIQSFSGPPEYTTQKASQSV